MHLACAMARNTGSKLVLLHLREVTNPALLGSGASGRSSASGEYDALKEYATIAEDYGLVAELLPMYFTSLADALAQAATSIQASVVFAHLPEGMFPLWTRFQVWNLRRQLTTQDCELYTLAPEQGSSEVIPAVQVQARVRHSRRRTVRSRITRPG